MGSSSTLGKTRLISEEPKSENTDELLVSQTGHPSRRTIVKGAAAVAWTVPAVTLMTAAPAAAASTNLHVTATGGYASSGANPTVVNFNLAVVVSGAKPANNLTMTLSVPPAAPHSTAPVFTAPAGWDLSGVATQPGGTGTAWVQIFVRAPRRPARRRACPRKRPGSPAPSPVGGQ